MNMIDIRRPVEVVEVDLDAIPGVHWMIVDKFDQPLIPVTDFMVAMCLKERLNASKGKVCLELEQVEVIKRLEKLSAEQMKNEPKVVKENDPNLYPEDFDIDPDKAKHIQQKEIDAGLVPKDRYKKPVEEDDDTTIIH